LTLSVRFIVCFSYSVTVYIAINILINVYVIIFTYLKLESLLS